MAEMYQIHQEMSFEISSTEAIIPKNANPMLKKLRSDLEAIHYTEDNVNGCVEDVDDFMLRQDKPNCITGSYKIRWNVVDSCERSMAATRFNNLIRQLLGKWLMDLERSENGLQLKITSIRNLG